MEQAPRRIDVVSGYFNPLHIGHLRLFAAAKTASSPLVVIVNNDIQQVAKIGHVFVPESARLELVRALKIVDRAMLAIDTGPGVGDTLTQLREEHAAAEIHFHNGGDRSGKDRVPGAEAAACGRAGITMHFETGGTEKMETSTRLRLGPA